MWSDALLRQEEKDVALYEGELSLAQESREEKADSSKNSTAYWSLVRC